MAPNDAAKPPLTDRLQTRDMILWLGFVIPREFTKPETHLSVLFEGKPKHPVKGRKEEGVVVVTESQ